MLARLPQPAAFESLRREEALDTMILHTVLYSCCTTLSYPILSYPMRFLRLDTPCSPVLCCAVLCCMLFEATATLSCSSAMRTVPLHHPAQRSATLRALLRRAARGGPGWRRGSRSLRSSRGRWTLRSL